MSCTKFTGSSLIGGISFLHNVTRKKAIDRVCPCIRESIGVLKIDLIIRVRMVNDKVTGITIMLIKYYFLTKCMVCVFVDSD